MSGMFTLAQALHWIPGGKLVGDGSQAVARVHSDTRTLQPGDLFVALKGERFDANDFLAEARRPRAPLRRLPIAGKLPAGFPGIEVDDSKLALASLASAWRAQFKLPLIAVTGSNGKTTVTQMIASILRAWQPQAHARHPRQFQQRHRPAADAAGPARAASDRRAGTGHEPSRRDRPPGAHRGAHRRHGQQRPAGTPGIHGHRGSGGARKRLACLPHWAPAALPYSPQMRNSRRCGRNSRARGPA